MVDEVGRGAPIALRPGSLAMLARAALAIGVLSPRRRFFWRLLRRALRRAPRIFARAVALAVQGEHLIRYTHKDVLPRLRQVLDQLTAARSEVHASPAPGASSRARRALTVLDDHGG